MEMRRKTFYAGIIAGFLLAGPASAAPVVEAEVTGTATNNTAATAQPIPDASFTTPVPPTVFDPPGWPTATISGHGGSPSSDVAFRVDVDFYSFSTGGGGALFDIDNNPFTFDTVVSLFNSSGTLIAFGDDSDPADSGTANSLDSFVGTIVLPAGNYFVTVSQWDNFPTSEGNPNAVFDELERPDGEHGGFLVSGVGPDTSFRRSGNDAGLAYTLHISLESPGVIPEPETYALLLAGLGLIGFAARRRAR
jgi:hypothetical protein